MTGDAGDQPAADGGRLRGVEPRVLGAESPLRWLRSAHQGTICIQSIYTSGFDVCFARPPLGVGVLPLVLSGFSLSPLGLVAGVAVDVAVLLYAVAVVGLVVSSPDWLVFVSRTVMG